MPDEDLIYTEVHIIPADHRATRKLNNNGNAAGRRAGDQVLDKVVAGPSIICET